MVLVVAMYLAELTYDPATTTAPMAPWALALLLIGAPVAIVCWFALVSWVLSVLSGWQALGRVYRAAEKPVGGKAFTSQSAMLRGIGYNHCLTLIPTEEGLFLSIAAPFRIASHPNLLIPWTAMRNSRVKRLWWMEMVAFDIGEPKITSMQVQRKVFQAAPEPVNQPQ